MILFILLAIGFALYTIFSDSGLIDSIKNIEETNKEVYGSVPKIIFQWFLLNIFFNVINFIFVFIISAIVVLCCPKAESYYTFNINSLKDNLVTSGEIHGGAFCVRGTIDGDISYFFSRTTDKGDIYSCSLNDK